MAKHANRDLRENEDAFAHRQSHRVMGTMHRGRDEACTHPRARLSPPGRAAARIAERKRIRPLRVRLPNVQNQRHPDRGQSELNLGLRPHAVGRAASSRPSR